VLSFRATQEAPIAKKVKVIYIMKHHPFQEFVQEFTSFVEIVHMVRYNTTSNTPVVYVSGF
jgi:hypothetical protein